MGNGRQGLGNGADGQERSNAASQGSYSASALRGSAITSRRASAYIVRIDTDPGGDAVAGCAAFDENFAPFITVLEAMPTNAKNASPAPHRQCVVARRARDRGQGSRGRTPGIAFWPTSVGQYRMRGADRAPAGETTLARRVARVLR